MTTARSAIQGTPTQKWVSGRTYGLDAIVWSPISKLTYVRIVAGAGTTDPSADSTNWEIFGPTRRKQLQYVSVTLAANVGFATATATIPSAVVASKCRLVISWGTQGANAWFGPATLSITAPTTLSVDFGVSTLGQSAIQVRIEIDETW